MWITSNYPVNFMNSSLGAVCGDRIVPFSISSLSGEILLICIFNPFWIIKLLIYSFSRSRGCRFQIYWYRFFTFSYLYMVEKVLFFSHIFGIKFLMDLHVLRATESENHIFSGWSVCVCLKNKVQQKPRIWYSTFASYVDATWNFSWKSDKNSVYRGTQKNSNTL